MKPALMTTEQHERHVLGIRADFEDGLLRVQVTSPHGCVRLGAANLDTLKLHVREALDAGARRMVLNLRDCLDIDARSMQALYSIRWELHRRDGEMIIEDANAELRALFEAYRIAEYFTFATSEETP